MQSPELASLFLTLLSHVQVQEILGDQPEVKEKMFMILKQYAAERKVDYLAYALAMVLTKESQHLLLDNIRYWATLLYGHFAPKAKQRADGWVSFVAFHLSCTCASCGHELVRGGGFGLDGKMVSTHTDGHKP